MVEIFSKRDGPDRQMKRFLGENRHTIDRLANHLTQGAWAARNTAPAEPELERATRVGFTPVRDDSEVEPRVRISPNNRVVLYDAATSRQIALLGAIRGTRHERFFVLATKDNGFVDPLNVDLAQRLKDLDGAKLDGPNAEDDLARTLTVNLGLPVGNDESEAGD